MKHLFFFLVVMSFRAYGNLIMSTTVDDDNEPMLKSILIEVPTLFGFEVDNEEADICQHTV